MTPYRELSKEQLQAMKADLEQQFEEVKAKGLNLDMSRGKPSKQQLELAMDMLEELKSTDKLKSEAGVDCRNYGLLDGIPELEFIVMYGFVEHLWSILLQMEFIFQQKRRQQKNGAFQFIRK